MVLSNGTVGCWKEFLRPLIKGRWGDFLSFEATMQRVISVRSAEHMLLRLKSCARTAVHAKETAVRAAAFLCDFRSLSKWPFEIARDDAHTVQDEISLIVAIGMPEYSPCIAQAPRRWL